MGENISAGDFRKTDAGVAICPFFTWTSEDIECIGHNEYDVSLTYCSHPNQIDKCEGNCRYKYCPILLPTETKDEQEATCVVPVFKEVVGCSLCKFRLGGDCDGNCNISCGDGIDNKNENEST